MITDIDVYVPEKLLPVLNNIYERLYSQVVMVGGRGAGKSQAVGLFCLLESYNITGNILVAREYQASIKDSMHSTLAKMVSDLGLTEDFSITNTSIQNLTTGSNIVFRGLRNNITSIKGIDRLQVVICDEAEAITAHSWEVLLPTMRYCETCLYVLFNPKFAKDATYQMFVADKSANRLCIEIQYYDNEMFPASLEKLRLEMYNKGVRENDLSLYNHIWLGQFLELSKSNILAHLVKVEDFEIDASFGSPYIGVDWGFANDDNVVVTCYVKGRNLYIHRVGMALGLPLNKTASWLIDNAPDILNYTSYADCARPETISKMQEDGIPKIKSCTKGKIADGVSYLQSFDSIIMHPRAGRAVEVQKKALNELMSYSYKVENKGKPNEQVTPEIQDKFNNCADAIRYALQPLIMKKKNSFSLAV